MNDNIHALAAAYALDALPDEERAFFERHLAGCEVCQEEVTEFQATAGRLGAAAAEAPPSGMRERVLAEVDRTRQVSPSTSAIESGGRPGSTAPTADHARPHLMLAAAIVAFAVVALGSATLLLDLTRTEPEVVLEPPPVWLVDADLVRVEGAQGVGGRFIYSAEHDEGWLLVDGLDPVDPERHAYQLWLFHDDVPVPAGVFVTGADGRAVFRAEAPVRGAELVAVTLEPAGGVPEPTGEVLVSSEL